MNKSAAVSLLALGALAAAIAACSSKATSADGDDGGSTNSSPATESASGSAPEETPPVVVEPSPNDPPPVTVPDTPVDDGGAPGDGGATTGDGGAAASCPAGSMPEAEPNDSLGAATNLPSPGSFCGAVGGNGDAVDFLKFTLPDTATEMSVRFTRGNVNVKIHVAGQTITLGGGGSIPFEPGEAYTFEVRSNRNRTTYVGEFAYK